MSPEPTLMGNAFERKSGVKLKLPAENNLQDCGKVQGSQPQ